MITPQCLQRVRLAKKLSLQEVAERSGYAQGTVWRMEQGQAVRWQVMVDVAVALGVLSAGRGTGALGPMQLIDCPAC